MLIGYGFHAYGPTRSVFSHSKNIIGLVFVSQSSSMIDFGGFRPFEVELTP